MRDKTEQILKAARDVFQQQGFLQTTTQEIAKQAEVAEVTLFRKFSTKKNLFLAAFKPIVERQFQLNLEKCASTQDTEYFLSTLLYERLETVSKNRPLIKMLISESLMNRLDEEVDLPQSIFSQLKAALHTHFSNQGQKVDAEHCARLISGILVSYVVWGEEKPFHQLSQKEKDERIHQYVQSLKASIGSESEKSIPSESSDSQ